MREDGASSAAPSAAPSHGQPFNFPSMLGVYLAVNAISDVYVLVDGPDCALYKAHFIHGRHDLESTLLRIDGRHRVCFTNVCSRGVVKRHDEILADAVLRLDALPDCAAVLLTALPMCSITGVDYGRVTRALTPGLKGAAFDVPPGSLTGDWLDGYAATLAALARSMELPRGRSRPGAVAVVGHLMDRNEADRRADVREIERLVAGLGLECVSVWLAGRPYAELGRAAEAEIVVSLPYARGAARVVAERVGARLVEAPLPFGLPKTAAFVRALGEAAGLQSPAEDFISGELSRLLPRFRWIFPHRFLGRRVAFAGDPHLLGGFLDIAADAGLEVSSAVLTARRAHGGAFGGLRVEHEPPISDALLRRLSEGADLLVSCHCDAAGRSTPVMEMGFPSYRHHAFFERPTLGFEGFCGFVDRLGGALSSAAAGR
ncbi:MAG: nitrogenase component 1 [Elusimicrobiota bacterium]